MKILIGNENFYHIYLAGNFDNIYQYNENTNKQLENEMEQNKRCNITHINARNIAYLNHT